ncbi:extracellular solute-binding protein [Rubrimonas cliftonensis]|uniref:Putative spermidine/putrescine transport system substrate-binding protein n=1 Tax=Rubrimonas cliftonensis TaxID=89524 RepID=A0A1H3WUH5_9RHOB|nr:extracellular solute-binding protein [Rubrimonas cliftonensis]SDZ90805.1 putative spermidine/putrescine transport system substrate-binding protein [Rubrimonas cliftonensis]
MTRHLFNRRAVLGGAAAATGVALSGLPARASGDVIAAIYPGSWEEAFRSIVGPALTEASGVNLELDPLYAVDQIAKARAARGLAPFDVFVLDPGPAASGMEMGLYQPLDMSKLSNAAKLPQVFVDDFSIPVAAQVVGIAYNPTKVAKPAGWADLFKPEFASRLGLTGFQTTFGTTSLIEISKIFGGSETDVAPAMEKIKEILPQVAAVAQPSAMAGLFQQGQIDLMYTNTQTVATLKGRGVDIEFAVPETGAIAFVTTMHIVKDAENVENAYKYLDTVISAGVQDKLMQAPFNFIPVNGDVDLLDTLPMASLDEMNGFVRHDWTKINPLRPGWIEQFNREVAA